MQSIVKQKKPIFQKQEIDMKFLTSIMKNLQEFCSLLLIAAFFAFVIIYMVDYL